MICMTVPLKLDFMTGFSWPYYICKCNIVGHGCFMVNIAKFLRTAFLQKTSGGCFYKCVFPHVTDVVQGSLSLTCR